MALLATGGTAALKPGFADPVMDAQRAFRTILSAMSYPGRIQRADVDLDPPGPLGAAAAAACLTLVDFETPLWLDGAASPAGGWLAFHTGAPVVGTPQAARFALVADPSSMPDLGSFDPGVEDYPDRSATLIVQVAGLAVDGPLRLAGPGIRDGIGLGVDGLPPAFWADWRANGAIFPLGVDVLLVAGADMVGLPRTVRVEG